MSVALTGVSKYQPNRCQLCMLNYTIICRVNQRGHWKYSSLGLLVLFFGALGLAF